MIDGLFICVGYVLQAWINLGFYQIKGSSLAWRGPLIVPCVVSLVLMASVYLFPESPRWLAGRNQIDLARQNLSKLRGQSPEEVTSELAAIELALEDASHAARKRDLFTMGEHKIFYRFMLGMVLQFFQQW